MNGHQLQRALNEAGMSQRAMAEAIDVCERSMRRYVSLEQVPQVIAMAVLYVCWMRKPRMIDAVQAH